MASVRDSSKTNQTITGSQPESSSAVEIGREPARDNKKAEAVAQAEGKPEPSSDVAIADSAHNEPGDLSSPIGFLKELYHRFNTDQCGAWAAALSFFSLLSVVPLLICGVAALGFIYNPEEAAQKVREFLVSVIPSSNASKIAEQMIANAGIVDKARDLANARTVTALVGIGSLVWSASRIFANAIAPMNAAFRAKETRNFIKTQAVCIGLMLAVGFIFLLSLLPAAGAQVLNSIGRGLGIGDPTPWWQNGVLYLCGVAISAVMYVLIYRFLPSPSAKVTWRQALVGGVTIAILWEALKQGFGLYLRKFNGGAGYDKVYGSLGSVVIVVLWVYYSSMLLLLGAEIARLYADRQNQKASTEAEKEAFRTKMQQHKIEHQQRVAERERRKAEKKR